MQLTRLATLVLLAAVSGTAAADDNPWKIEPLQLVDVGVYKQIPKPKDRDVDLKDHPIVRRIHPLYQKDQKYAKMFSPTGASNICGPTSAAMVLFFLKDEHKPLYPKIFKDRKDDETAVKHMYDLMGTDPSSGTSGSKVNEGMWQEVQSSGYKVSRESSFIIGASAGLKENQIAPTAEMLHKTHNHGDAAVLHFGWYKVTKDGDKWQVKRDGGHYVVLAGVDREKPNTFYVTNPLVDYASPDKRWWSKIELEEIDLTSKSLKNDGDHPLKPHMLFTRDLTGGHAAILEEIIVVAPE